MNTPNLERYPFDSTGEALTNRVENEEHIIPPGDKNKIIALLEGCAFSDSIKLRYPNGTYLRPWVDYQPVNLYPEATQATAEACTGMVMIINESAVGKLIAEYQLVGGQYGHNSMAVEDLLWAATKDERPVFWPDIHDRPLVFPPSPHTHDIFNETYAWDARITLVDTWVASVLEQADADRVGSILRAVDVVDEYLAARHMHAMELLDQHAETEDAHATSKAQAGLDKLDNISKATLDQARAGDRTDLRLTVGGASAILSDALEDYSSNLMKQGILPISRWGNLTYLQPGVSGSFEGAAQYQSHDRFVHMIEVDGTFVRLRPGSNGVDVGLYYDYMANAVIGAVTAEMVYTNNKYTPAALNQAYIPNQVMQSDGKVMMGMMVEKAALPAINTKYWVAIMNGTLDHTKHNCVEVINTQVTLSNGAKLDMDARNTSVFQLGDRLYTVTGAWDQQNYRTPGSAAAITRLEWAVCYVELATVRANQTAALTQITGITTNSLGRSRSGNTIIVADQVVGYPGEDGIGQYNGSNKSWTAISRGWASPILRAGLNTDGTVNLTGLLVYNQNSPNNSGTGHWGFRLTFNPSSKQAVMLDNPQKHQWYDDASGEISALITANGTNLNMHNVSLLPITDGYSDYITSPYLTYDGYIFTSVRHGAAGQNATFNIHKVNGFTNRDEVNANPAKFTYTLLRNFVDFAPYGSNNKGLLRHPQLFPNNVLFYYGKETVDMNSAALSQQLIGEPTFPYKLLQTGSLVGYQPTNTRNYATQRMAPREIITEIATSGAVTTHCACGSQWVPTGPSDVQPNLTTSGQADIVLSELNAQIERVVAAANVGLTKYKGSLIIPRNGSIPLMLKITGILPPDATTGVRYSGHLVTTVTYGGGRTGSITGWSANLDDIKSGIVYTGTYDIGVNNQIFGHLFYQDTDGGWLFVLGGFAQTQTVGPGAQIILAYGKVNTNGRIGGNAFKVRGESPYGDLGSRIPIAFPGKGIYLTDSDSPDPVNRPYPIPFVYQTGGGWALVARRLGTTLDSIINWNYNDKLGEAIVLTSHVVEQGWILYFTEEVPVILNGREGETVLTSIDLRSITASPGNKTFYVYVNEANGTMTYEITTTEKTPTMSTMFIGTVVTSASQITKIDITKRSRIGIYQLSDTQTGMSVPVSTGLPFQTGDWSWDYV
jgi:hypothetical protein